MTDPPKRTSWLTWTSFERAVKFGAGLFWGNAEVGREEVRWEVFAFILAIWAGTEAPRVLRGLLELRRPPVTSSDDTSTDSVPS